MSRNYGLGSREMAKAGKFALNNACKIYSIPKIGYKHFANREGSLFDTYLKTMPVAERKFWFETATKEANILNDRPIDLSRLQNAAQK